MRRTPRKLRHARNTARLTSPVRRDTGFANTLRWLCHAGLGTETETAFSNGFEASARPSSESDIQRARAIPASDKRFAKKGRVAGTQKRIGLNVPERSALLFSAHIVWAGCAYKGLSMVDRRASERVTAGTFQPKVGST